MERITVTNGANRSDRRLLRGAAVQLRDAAGNAAEAAGVPLRWRLDWGEAGGSAGAPNSAHGDSVDGGGAPGGGSRNGVLPSLELPELAAGAAGAADAAGDAASSGGAVSGVMETDSRGRAFFGDILVAEGSGRVDPDEGGRGSGGAGGAQVLACVLVLQRWVTPEPPAVAPSGRGAPAAVIWALLV